MTVEQFTARLGAWGESIQNMQPTLDSIAEIVTPQIKQRYRESGLKTGGPLYNSIQADATSNTTVTISMLDYGLYNNYGVNPTPSFINGGGMVKTNNFGTKFKYGSRTFGLPSRQFFDVETLQERIAQDIAIEITEQF